MPDQLRAIIANLRSFGARRLLAMAAVAAIVVAVIGVGSVVLNRPAYETLYVGLDRSDINQIGLVLGESGIAFDVGSDGTSVLVEAGKTAQARMLLAEKGLPTSNNAGYELFDNVGSLGLTSFMQEVTRVRALEGEIARTIQTIAGVKAARVHLVMSEHANFRREEQQPSASVVIRYAGNDAERSAIAIRHLVAAAVPGLSVDKVTVLDSEGALLAAGDDPSNSSLTRSLGIERTVESQVEENIHRALSPYLGADNFRASVSADVNTDTKQIEETFFDPDSRVERSVQTVKSQDANTKSGASTPASVDQNLPDQSAAPKSASSAEASNSSERKEEITNYEINSRKVATTSNGYSISKLSIAVVVNQARLTSVLGADATPEKIAARIADIQKVVATAAGFNQTRGDSIDVTAVEFMPDEPSDAAAAPGIVDRLETHAGTLINAGAFVVVALLVVFFGLRPLVSTLTRPAGAESDGFARQFALGGPQAFALPDPTAAAGVSAIGGGALNGLPAPSLTAGNPIADDIGQRIKPAPQERLTRMLDLSEERTALILRKWAGQEAA